MAQIIQLRNDAAANWTSVNPILAIGEPGYELVTGNMKVGDGVTHWNSLPYKIFNIKGDTGNTGTGLSRTTTSTIDFSDELQYVEKIINDPLIKSNSIIIIQIIGGQEEYQLQGVQCGVVSIIDSTSYIIYAIAPDGASGIMNINILIF
jgi:hypothetical protein